METLRREVEQHLILLVHRIEKVDTYVSPFFTDNKEKDMVDIALLKEMRSWIQEYETLSGSYPTDEEIDEQYAKLKEDA